MSVMRWLTLMLGLLVSAPVWPTSYGPPEPIALPFGPGKAELHDAVRSAIDRLAVRALRCSDDGGEEIVVTLVHQPQADSILLRQRKQAVRARFGALQLPVTVRSQPDSEAKGDEQERASPAPPWAISASVQVGESDLCWDGDTPPWWFAHQRLQHWLDELERGLAARPQRLPAFWQVLTPSVRRDHLSFALARMAYLRWQEGSRRAREVYWWLVRTEAQSLPLERRLLWGLHLWVEGSDEDLQELHRRLAIQNLDVQERASRAPQLMHSKLPWPVIERRLLADEVVRLAGETLRPTLGSSDSRLNMTTAVIERKEWASWARLTRAAGAARACFLSDAIFLLQPHRNFDPSPHIIESSIWAAGPAGRFDAAPLQSCDPSANLLVLAVGCTFDSQSDATTAALWVDAGLILDPQTLNRALSPTGLSDDGECRIEHAPGQRFPFRLRLQ